MRATYCSLAAVTLGCVSASTNSTTNSTTPNSLLSSGYVNLGEYQSAYEKAKAFVSTLTNDQKVTIITGGSLTNGSAAWTALITADGVAGINGQYFASAFPEGQAVAMTWDKDHFEAHAKANGAEFYLEGYNLVDGPVVGPLGRTLYGGRSSEAYSPDPYLSGIAIGKAVKGMNSAGVITTGRHFLLNEQETNRSSGLSSTTTAVYSSNADDKTIHELYLWPFADAVRAGMGSVMCGMTKVNGTLSCQNSKLVSGLLKEELGFPGSVVPDVNGQDNSYGSANAGLDLGSSSYWTTEILEAGIANGSFTQARLDDMVERLAIGYYFAGLDDGKQQSKAALTDNRNVRSDHAKLIRTIGQDSLVLLKNNKTSTTGLPLNQPMVVSVFGAHAGPATAGPNFVFSVQGIDDPYEGHCATSGGSGQGSMSYLITPLQALTDRAVSDGSMLRWIIEDSVSSTSSSSSLGGGGGGGMPSMSTNSSSTSAPDASNSTSSMTGGGGGGGGGISIGGRGTELSTSYATYAANSDVCLVFINSASGEGGDRSVLYHADQDTMVATVASNCNNTIVVINAPGTRLVDQWIENVNVTAVLYGSLLGQESGRSIVNVLYGDVNPSGKLVYTIAKNETDYPVSICYTEQCDFSEGVYIDYRYFDEKNISVRYPFGHGLSYTTFSLSDLAVTSTDATALAAKYPTGKMTLGGYSDLFDEVITLTATVKNTGDVVGSEVAQLYVTFPSSADQPPYQLRGFEKVALEVGEEKEVTFSVRRRDVSYWDVAAQQWAIATGTYKFSLGASSRDLKCTATVVV